MTNASFFNPQLYVRGDPRNYDEWEAMGCEGWGYDSVLPYFKKSENFGIPEDVGFNSDVHGKSGPLQVSDMQFADLPTSEVLIHPACLADDEGFKFHIHHILIRRLPVLSKHAAKLAWIRTKTTTGARRRARGLRRLG